MPKKSKKQLPSTEQYIDPKIRHRIFGFQLKIIGISRVGVVLQPIIKRGESKRKFYLNAKSPHHTATSCSGEKARISLVPRPRQNPQLLITELPEKE